MPTKYTRVIFTLSDPLRQQPASTRRRRGESEASSSQLFFNDQRKFGWIKVGNNEELSIINGKLGPEPLEQSFSWDALKSQLLRRKNTPIKVALLDQSVVAGIGNIYASETCFLAGVDPQRKVNSLSDDDFKKIYRGVVDCLTAGIKHGGSSKTHFLDIEGKKGNFLDFAYVYNRQGQKCKVCGAEIIKTVLGGRGTFSCQKCQR